MQSQAIHETVISSLGSVRNKGKHGLFILTAYRIDDLRHERRTHRLSLAVNERIIAAGKINFLKRARREALWRHHRRIGKAAIGLDGDDRSGIHRFDLIGLSFKYGHKRHALGRECNDLISHQHVAWPDTTGIAHHEHVTITNHPANRIATIPGASSFRYQSWHIERRRNPIRHVLSGNAGIAQLAVKVGVSLVEMIADFLQNRLRVGAENRMLTTIDQHLVQLRGIGHVEVAHHHQRPRRPVAATQIGMTGTFIKLAGGTVTQMADENLTTEIKAFLDALGVGRIELFFAGEFVELLDLLAENFGQRVFLDATPAERVGLTLWHVELHAADARAVLTTVVLFLHEKKQLVEAPQRGAVAVVIIGKRFAKSHRRDPAFVFEEIAHDCVSAMIIRLSRVPALLPQEPCGRSKHHPVRQRARHRDPIPQRSPPSQCPC